MFRELYVDSKRPYTSHFPSSNKIAWQNNPVQLLPSIAPNSQHNQAGNVEDSAKITTTPVCDVSIFFSNLIYCIYYKILKLYLNNNNNNNDSIIDLRGT